MRIICFLFNTTALLLAAALPAQEGLLTPEALWKIGRVSLFAVSPDDSLVLYGVNYTDLETNTGNLDLYTIRLDGGSRGTPHRLTHSPESESNACYRPDGKKIGFLREGRLWEMNPDGSNPLQVSDISMNGFAYSPDGSRLLFTREIPYPAPPDPLFSNLPKTSGKIYDDLLMRHWDSWEDDQYQTIFYTDYEDGKLSGEPVNILDQPFDSPLIPSGGMEQVQWSPDGKRIAYTCKKSKGKEAATSTDSDIYLYDLGTAKTVNLSEGMPGYDLEPVFSPSGQYIAWNSQERPGYEADRWRVFIRDLKTGQRWEMTKGMDQNARNPKWSAASDRIFFISEMNGVNEVWGVNFAAKGKLQKLSAGFNDFLDYIPTKANTFAALICSMSEPPEVYRHMVETAKSKQVTFTNADLWATMKMGKVEKRMFQTTDKKRLHSWVVYPPDFDPAKKYPAVLYCQGGPQSMVSQNWSYRWNLQIFAAAGYIVVAPNRRGVPGFGQDWTDAIAGDWGGQPMQDLLQAIDQFKKEPFVDSTRLGAMGPSFGGFSVYWLEGHHQKRFKAFIAHCGVFNLESFYGSTEEIFFANQDLGGPPWQSPMPETYLNDSPHRYVQNWDTPILIIHNGSDYRVPLEQGLQAYTAARMRDIPSRFLYFPEENHFVSKPQNAVLWHRAMLDWLGRYL